MKRKKIVPLLLASILAFPQAVIATPVLGIESEISVADSDVLQVPLYYEKGAEDATGSMSETQFNWDGNPVLKNCEFTRPGYVFKGWTVRFEAQVDLSDVTVVYYLAYDSSGVLKAVSKNELNEGGYQEALFQGGQTIPLRGEDADLSTATLLRNGGELYATAVWEERVISMYRLYNPNSGEHFYTANTAEKNQLVNLGWKYEGEGWKAPESSSIPVYRLYNKNAGDHHYTMNIGERDNLVNLGWDYEGIGWYSDESQAVPLYRQYNPNAKAGSHNYTTSKSENDYLVTIGWKEEGIAWYGTK